MNDFRHKIGLGSVQFGISYGISNTHGKTSPKEVEKILDIASSKSINVIDTASSYGTAEQILGNLHKGRFDIISKFMPTQTNGSISFQLEKSLYNLKVDYLYGYMAHRPALLEGRDWEELQLLKKEGRIKKIGFSFNNPKEFEKLKNSGFIPNVVQVPFNYFDTRFKDLLIELKAEGCEVHTRSTFLQGLFFMNPENLVAYFNKFKSHINFLQSTYGNNLQTALLEFVLRQDFIDKVIIGVENVKQLEKNINSSLKIEPLNDSPYFPENILMPVNWPKN
ncbi:aldo/keto reductase [Antarcticibacterium arcticum]|uniref:Aldo/keto reductase n=1 Tax=Antarcticibacterium arcticum TaxID=2585771 RepID=A0A5B8YFJ4_9FLAO|nr:aldo/keto reductase [Antarcticibacterium arcticum]QED36514.1 aldo/keto reductase [Antarcticibacterium arcticum]